MLEVLNVVKERAMLERLRSGFETIGWTLIMEQKMKHRILIFLWQWWSARNKANSRSRMASASEICNCVLYHVKE